jgi:hypothetical protein
MSRDNSTPTKCGRLPAADVAYDAFVGFAFAHATNSAHVFAPLCGPAASANWNVAPSPIAVKSLTGIVRDRLQRMRDHGHRPDGHHHDHRAVGRGSLDGVSGNPSRGTRAVLDDDRLTDAVLELVGNDAGDEIGGAAGREPDENPHRLVHAILREKGRGECEQQRARARVERQFHRGSNPHSVFLQVGCRLIGALRSIREPWVLVVSLRVPSPAAARGVHLTAL